MKKAILLKLLALVACLMCALGASAAQAYACYTSSDSTLSFYYDNLSSTRPGTTYDLNTGSNVPGWYTDGTYHSVTQVVFDPSFANVRPISTSLWFAGMSHLKSIAGMAYLNTSNVTSMGNMFESCSSLTSLDLSGFNTSNVRGMASMFYDCSNLTSLDLSSFNTSNVTGMDGMFYGCSGLTSLDLSGFNTSNVTKMYNMFQGCSGLTSLDLSSFTTSNVTRMNSMFFGCINLTTIYVSNGWSTTAVTKSEYMFYGCRSLVGGMGTTYNVSHTDATYAHIDGGLSNPGYFTDINTALEPEAYACYTPSNLKLTFYYDYLSSTRPGTIYSLNTSYSYPGWVRDQTCSDVMLVEFDSSFADARPTSTSRWFAGMSHLKSIAGMAYLNTSEVTDMSGMFEQCNMMASLDLSHFNTANVTDMSCMFNGLSSDESSTLDLSNFNTAKVTDMLSMFGGCRGLTSLDLSSFNTSDVTNMQEMFFDCSNLTTIYVSNGWSTAAVTSSDNMFTYCTSLVGGRGTTYDPSHVDAAYAHIDGGSSNPGYFTNINTLEAYACYTADNTTLTFYYDNQRSSRPGTTYDLNDENRSPDWATTINSSVTQVVFDPSFAYARPISTIFWFYSMSNLSTITGIEYLNTSDVTKMNLMFSCCSSLMSLDLSSFNTANVISMESMFAGCTSLMTLNLSSFNTSKVTDMFHMFYNCSSLTTIYVDDGWSTAAVTSSDNMFTYCTSLVGGMGTIYDANHVDAAYAHIDGGPSNPGYFTAAGAQPWTEPEAYACYTVDNKTLTFYFDNQRSSREGNYVRTYDLPTGDDLPGWGTDYTNIWVTSVVFDSSFVNVLPTSTSSWFSGMSDLLSITGMKEYLNTSEVTDMRYMFSFCNKLTGLDLSGFNTQNVAHMDSMFYLCSALTSLDLSNFNTSNVTTMNAMFIGCSGLTTLDLSSFNTANVTTMTYLFRYCSGLKTIFAGDGWSTASAPYGLVGMFQGCTSLVGGRGTAYDPNHTDGSYAHIDGGPSNPGYFTAAGTEAYACYTPGNTTLTFYYDTERGTRPGTTYDLNEGNTSPQWYSQGIYSAVTQVVFDPSFAGARPVSTGSWFYKMSNLESITGMEYLNTSEVTVMSYMFCSCGLTSIDLSHFNTESVTSMYAMFSWCRSMNTLDLSNFNTAKVQNMGRMFRSSAFTSLDVSSFNTSSVTNMIDMFAWCSDLTTIYVGDRWDTGAVTDSEGMFAGSTSLVGGMGTTYDADHIDKAYAHIDGGPSNPGYFTAEGAQPWTEPEAYACYTPSDSTLTFYYDGHRGTREGTTYDLNKNYNEPQWLTDGTCSSVTLVVFDPSFADARPTTTLFWFEDMANLQSITGMKEYLNTSAVTNMVEMFYNCSALTSLDVSGFNTANVIEMAYMFGNCNQLASLDVSGFNTANVKYMDMMFCSCSGLTTIYAGDDWSTAAVVYSQNMFGDDTLLVGGMGTTYDANHVDAAYAHIDGGPSNPGYFTAHTEAYACYTADNTTLTFYCDSQRSRRTGTTYDLNEGMNNPGWRDDGTNASVTRVVFDPSFADARPTSTFKWFQNMGGLDTITGIAYLNTEAVTTMLSMFDGCSGLTSLDLSHFNTVMVTSMDFMFYRCSGLTSLDLSSFNTSNVTTMHCMFFSCSGLTSLDLSSFNTSNVTNMDYMFSSSDNLTTINVGDDWSTAAVTSSNNYMFSGCTSLVGGMGTTYDSSHIGKEYAHIDGGPSNPGYFTAKVDFVRGDVDGDGNVNIDDVTALIDYLLGTNSNINLQGADCDESGDISIDDVTTLIDYLLTSHWGCER